jgi:hypothetical protein
VGQYEDKYESGTVAIDIYPPLEHPAFKIRTSVASCNSKTKNVYKKQRLLLNLFGKFFHFAQSFAYILYLVESKVWSGFKMIIPCWLCSSNQSRLTTLDPSIFLLI